MQATALRFAPTRPLVPPVLVCDPATQSQVATEPSNSEVGDLIAPAGHAGVGWGAAIPVLALSSRGVGL